MVPAGAALAGYTALLFNQCEGRDLWQSPLLLPHTIVNALLAGAGALGIVAPVRRRPPAATERALGWTLVLGAVASAALIALDTFGRHPHAAGRARRAQPVARPVRERGSGWACIARRASLRPRCGAAFLVAGGVACSPSPAPLRWSACGSTRTRGCARARACR